jgi:hypothetical protein
MKVRAKFSVGTACSVFAMVALMGLLYFFGKKDLAVGAGIVGTLLTALLPQLLMSKDAVEVKVGKSDPPAKEEPPKP